VTFDHNGLGVLTSGVGGLCCSTNVTRINGECGHMFCGICVTQAWSKHTQEANDEGIAPWRPYQCATCRRATTALVERGVRTRENMPFKVDGVMERLVSLMYEQGRKLGDKIKELREGIETGEGEEEWRAMEGRWGVSGEISREREYGRQASMDAMTRFERYWLNFESEDVIGHLGLFRGIEGESRRTVPDSPHRRRGAGRMQVRPLPRPLPRPRPRPRIRTGQDPLEYDSDVQIVAGPSTSNVGGGGRGRGRGRAQRRGRGDDEFVPLAASSDVEIVSD
jgi:hypothetical protein